MPMYHPDEISKYPGDVVVPTSPLFEASMAIAEDIGVLQDMLMSLETRLSPLLRPTKGENRREDSALIREIGTSQHVTELQKHSARLQDVRHSLGWLLERLDV